MILVRRLVLVIYRNFLNHPTNIKSYHGTSKPSLVHHRHELKPLHQDCLSYFSVKHILKHVFSFPNASKHFVDIFCVFRCNSFSVRPSGECHLFSESEVVGESGICRLRKRFITRLLAFLSYSPQRKRAIIIGVKLFFNDHSFQLLGREADRKQEHKGNNFTKIYSLHKFIELD